MKTVFVLSCLIIILAACNSVPHPPTITAILPPMQVIQSNTTPISAQTTQLHTPPQITGTLVVVLRQATDLSATAAITMSHLGIVTLPDGALAQLTTEGYQDQEPRWSPDRQVIAFSSNRSGQFDIFLINQNGSDLTQLTEGKVDKFSPTWSPDGRKLAFVTRKIGKTGLGSSEINILDLETREAKSVLEVQANEWEKVILALDWSPTNSDLMLYSTIESILSQQNEEYSASRVYLFDLISGESTLLTPAGWTCVAPHWSPNGQLVLMNGCSPVSSDGGSSPMIGTLVNTGGNFRLEGMRLLESVASVVDITWAPDGTRWIADQFERDGTSTLLVHPVQNYLDATAHPLLAPFDMISAVGKRASPLLELNSKIYSYRQPDWK